MNKVQEMQNEIYRKMTARKKLEIVIGFFRTGMKLNSLKYEKVSRTRKSNQNIQNT